MISLDEISKPDFFHCNYCHQPIAFLYASALHGVILLFGQEDGYFGTVCPKCQKTNLRKSKKEDCESIKSIFNKMGRAKGFHEDVLRYYSIPHRNVDVNDPSDHQIYSTFIDVAKYHDKPYQFEYDIQGGYPKEIYEFQTASLSEYQNETFEVDLPPPRDLTGRYSTFQEGDKAIEPIMWLLWLKEETIDAFVAEENRTGFKKFPRYMLYDGMIEFIENMCWEHKGMWDFLSVSDDQKNSLVWPQKNGGSQRNSDFLMIISGETECLVSGKLIFESPMLAFMREFHEPSTPTDAEVESAEGKVKDSLPMPFTTENGNKEAEIDGKLLDDCLSTLSGKFIAEYADLAGKITFSRMSVATLALRYAEEFCDLKKSPQKCRMLRKNRIEEERRKVEEAEKCFPSVKIVSADPRIDSIKLDIVRFAPRQVPNRNFLLLGETGTGKELFAKAIHEASRRKGAIIDVNCPAIPDNLLEEELFGHKKGSFTDAKEDRSGKFEVANGGTIFLDEIGDLNLDLQAKILRVIQERKVRRIGESETRPLDVIVVSATNKPLKEEVKQGKFREDLYYRIRKFEFVIPPLRERKDDIPLLVNHFIQESDYQRKENPDIEPFQVTEKCMEILRQCTWKGNVRQLKDVIEKIIERRIEDEDRVISSSDLPEDILEEESTEDHRAEAKNKKRRRPEDQELLSLEKAGYTRLQVAEKYGVARETATRWYSDIRKKRRTNQ